MVPTLSERAGHFDPALADNAAVCSAIAGWVSGQYRCQPIASISTADGYVSGITNSEISSSSFCLHYAFMDRCDCISGGGQCCRRNSLPNIPSLLSLPEAPLTRLSRPGAKLRTGTTRLREFSVARYACSCSLRQRLTTLAKTSVVRNPSRRRLVGLRAQQTFSQSRRVTTLNRKNTSPLHRTRLPNPTRPSHASRDNTAVYDFH